MGCGGYNKDKLRYNNIILKAGAVALATAQENRNSKEFLKTQKPLRYNANLKNSHVFLGRAKAHSQTRTHFIKSQTLLARLKLY